MPVATETHSSPSLFLPSNRKRNKDRALARLERQIANLDQIVDAALQLEIDASTTEPPSKPDQIAIWGCPLFLPHTSGHAATY